MKCKGEVICLKEIFDFKNGKKRPAKIGNIPVYGGNGILAYTAESNCKNCIIIGRVGAYCGNVFYERNQCWVSDNAIYAKTKADTEIQFAYYLLKNLELNKKHIGTGQPLLTQEILNRIECYLPSKIEQKRIAAILTLLDKKIELNNAINNNLEQQAKALFKSWFVDFEPFGGIQPPEMHFVPLNELCKTITKGTTPTTLGKSFTSSGVNFIKAETILSNHSIDSSKFAFIDEETNLLLKRSIIEANDILFTIAGTLGRFALVDEYMLPANTNQAVAIIRPDESKVSAIYLYSFFIGNWHNDFYSKRIQQAVQANLSLATIKSLPITILSADIMSKYSEMLTPLFALMKSNEAENHRLAKLRDALLPRLMSGEIDVSDIDI